MKILSIILALTISTNFTVAQGLSEIDENLEGTPIEYPVKRVVPAPKWPSVVPNTKMRLVRLEYSNGDWDQQMGKGSNYNMLLYYKAQTNFPIADDVESILTYDKNSKNIPPFITISGQGRIELSSKQKKFLRWYCLEKNGLLFADNGGGSFNRSFKMIMADIFSDYNLVPAKSTDALFFYPHRFENGPPPLWHHSGTESLLMKDKERIFVFYHQGDVNDAWRDGGSGVSKAVQDSAFNLGVNIMFYSSLHFYGGNVEGLYKYSGYRFSSNKRRARIIKEK